MISEVHLKLHRLCPQMIVTFDDHFLLTVSEDGSLFIWQIIWERYGLKKDKEVCYLEEIFITKSDLQEKVETLLSPLRPRVILTFFHDSQFCFTDGAGLSNNT